MTTPTPMDENLLGLERLMTEFFAPTTSNERKRDIEKILSDFGQQKNAWKDCLHFMANTSNHYVCMFSLTTLENFIHRQWMGMLPNEKSEIRTTLNNFLAEHHKSAPAFIRNKLIKLIVDIAKTDWPHFYHDFFHNIYEYIHTKHTMTLGLTMLLITSEELATPRDNLSSTRKVELKKLMNEQAPQMLSVLTNLLDTVLDKLKRHNTTTPPPSPSHGEDIVRRPPASPIQAGSLLHFAGYKILGRPSHYSPVAPLDSDCEEVAALALKCLTHSFTWIPLSSHITPKLLSLIFQCAVLDAQSQTREGSPSDLNSSSRSDFSLGTLAIGAINEIMYKNCVPSDFEEYLLRLFQNAFQLLQTLVEDTDSATPKIHGLDDEYIDKFTEFLRSFVSSHLRRFEGNSQFPFLEFLALLFKYTFQQTRVEAFYACLDIWAICMDYIQGFFTSRRVDGPAVLARYHEALVSLVVQVLKKLQFKYNLEVLEELDDKSLDDDNQTEWQCFLSNCIETIMRVAELLPDDVLRILDSTWKETTQVYLQLEKFIVDGKKFVLPDHSECQRLHCLLRDFSSLLQIIGRLSSLYHGDTFHERLNEGNDFIKQLLVLAAFASKTKLYTLEVPFAVLTDDFVDVHAQTLAALKAWCHWLSQLHSLSLKNPATYEPQCRELTSRIMVAVASVIKDGHSPKLVHAAAHFLVTLTGTVRPPSIWKLKEFTELYNGIHQLKLEPEDHRLLVRALANVLLLNWPGIADQRWDERKRHLTKFLKDLTEDFRKIRSMVGFPSNRELQLQAKPVISHTLRMLADLIENILNEVTQTKKLCHHCVKEYIDITLWLFPAYVSDSQMCEELFSFFHVAFDVLKSHMGYPFVEEVIQTFLSLFTKEQLAQSILNEGSSGIRVIEKFLGILQFIVKEPQSSFRKFIPNTLSLCLEHIYPLIAEKPTADIKGPLYHLLYQILLHNWQYFFKSSVIRTLGAPTKEEHIQNDQQFIQIMQAFGQSFLQPDISVFKQNLEALEHLNSKWKLYHKSIFMDSLIAQFLTVFLQVLVHRSHDILQEEIVISVYNMASVDFNAFFTQFLDQFLNGMDGLDAGQRNSLKAGFVCETDLPTFTSSVTRFVNDLRYYRICNSSLPDGSVKL